MTCRPTTATARYIPTRRGASHSDADHVATLFLAAIERSVGTSQQAIHGCLHLRWQLHLLDREGGQRGDPKTHRDVQSTNRGVECLGNAVDAQFLRYLAGALQIRGRKNDRKLLAAEAGDPIARAQRGRRALDEATQHLITHHVSMGVVDTLESI